MFNKFVLIQMETEDASRSTLCAPLISHAVEYGYMPIWEEAYKSQLENSTWASTREFLLDFTN
jgi:hypothetical protein